MTPHPYANLLTNHPLAVEDPQFPYLCFTERHLQAMWYEQKYFKNLFTSDGKRVEVLSPGIWNGEAGPDFLKAHIILDGMELRGAVEIHLGEDQWKQHGHHIDDRYNDVILHIALWNSKNPYNITTSNGRFLHKVCIENFLTVPINRILHLIDLDMYPYRRFVGSGRCARELFVKLPQNKIDRLFETAADWRLHQKYENFKLRLGSPNLFPSAGIAMGLGYKHNTESFFELFLELLRHNSKSEEKLFALGLELCGFFDGNKWEKSAYFQSLWQATTTKRLPLILSQIRPLNHPVRRIFYLVKLIKDPATDGLYSKIIGWWKNSYHLPKLRHEIEKLIPLYRDDYWNNHYTFEEKAASKNLPLIGKTLTEEICINTLLPIIHHEITEDKEKASFHKLFYSFNANKKGKTEYLRHRFFGDTLKRKTLNKAIREQGAYQIHRDFCYHYEASCEGCPFISRYQRQFS